MPELIVRGGIVEAPPDGMGGPRWIATLENGTVVIGRPSYSGSGPVALPNDEPRPMSDWRRLMARCEDTGEVIKRLSLWVPPFGLFTAPDGRGGYGYFEVVVRAQKKPRQGTEALAICWPEKDGQGRPFIKVQQVHACGRVDFLRRSKWLPCMIGEQQAYEALKDRGERIPS